MATKTITKAELTDLLCSLGDSSLDIAKALAAAGIKGYREEPQCCPVANWLSQRVPGAVPNVQRTYVELEWPDGPDTEVPTPPAVRFFIGAFDSYEYPELDERPPSDDD